jgi:hypothetical protein
VSRNDRSIVFRSLLAATGVFWFPILLLGQEAPQSASNELPPSTVFFARDPNALAVDKLTEDAAVTGQMVNRLVLACTGRGTVEEAWRALVTPKDRVGIKISTSGGRYFSTHRGVVEAIVAGLAQAGVPRRQIVVWDRDAANLRAAGFTETKGSYAVRGIEPIRGYDAEAALDEPVQGKLIWGDLLFHERQRKTLHAGGVESDQLSSLSHLATILSREVTKVINVPVLCDEANCGVAGALYNMTIPNIDNWRRFIQSEGSSAESIPSLYSDERIGRKVILHVMDGLVAQYAAGPGGNLNYAFPHATIYMSTDPVALDAVALRELEVWRKQMKLPRIGHRADWLGTAEELGLGNFAETRIVLQPVASAK